MKPIVEVKNLRKNYGEKEAVKSISFKINENEILGLLGPNGSGKTTTIGMMLGLLKPTSGDILIEGKKIEENRIEILKKINFISPYIELPKKLTEISILLASHNMNEVTRLCKSILMMKDGKLIDSGNPEMLIQKHGRKNLEEVFLKLSRSKNEYN